MEQEISFAAAVLWAAKGLLGGLILWLVGVAVEVIFVELRERRRKAAWRAADARLAKRQNTPRKGW